MSYQDNDHRDVPPPIPDRREYDQYEEEDRQRYAPPAEKKGCSKGCLYISAGCGCLTVLALIGMGIAAYLFMEKVANSLTTDPAVVRTRLQEMAEIVPPENLEPVLAADILVAKVIFYQSADKKSLLSLIEINPSVPQGPQGKGDFGDGFRKGYKGGPGLQEREYTTIGAAVERTLTIRGQETKVYFRDAKTSAGEEYKLVDASFKGKVSNLELRMEVPTAQYDEAKIDEFLESIK